MPTVQEPEEFPEHWAPLHARPSQARPWEWAWAAVSAAVVVTSMVLFLSGHAHSGLWFVGISVGVLAILSLFISRAKGKLIRSRQELLHTKAFRVCPECLYDLTQVPSPGACPECGTGFVAEQLPDVWRRIDERWEERQRTSGTGG